MDKVLPRVSQALSMIVLFPAIWLHELTHVIAAAPFGTIASISVWPPYIEIDYPAGTPRLAVRLANLAPTIMGLIVGVPLFLSWGVWGLQLPLLVYVVGSWLVYTKPSSDDFRPFMGAE